MEKIEMYGCETVTCKIGKDGLNYVEIKVVKDGKEYSFNTLVKSGSGATILGAKSLGITVEGLKKAKVTVGFEEIEVYEAEIESISIADQEISGVEMIYVSDLKSFDETPVFGNDYLGKMNFHKGIDEPITLEFNPYNLGDEIVEERRAAYLLDCKREQISFTLKDWFFIEDGIYPTSFELVLVVMKDGSLSGGCVERGSRYTDDNWRGVIHQSRGRVIDYEDILAWKPIEGLNVFEDTIYH